MFGNYTSKFDTSRQKSPLAMYDDEDENLFVPEDVNKIIRASIEAQLTEAEYASERVGFWTTSISEQILAALGKLNKMFKYVVTCSILQRSGAGLHTASACFWDNGTDGTCTVRWENDTLYCIVTVYGLAI